MLSTGFAGLQGIILRVLEKYILRSSTAKLKAQVVVPPK